MNYRTSDTAVCRSCADRPLPADVPVMVFIPRQEWEQIYTAERALRQGTLFPALDKPFFGKGGCCGG